MRHQFVGSYTDQQLLREIRRINRENPDFGYRRILKTMNASGWTVSHKPIYRLMRCCRIQPPPKSADVVDGNGSGAKAACIAAGWSTGAPNVKSTGNQN